MPEETIEQLRQKIAAMEEFNRLQLVKNDYLERSVLLMAERIAQLTSYVMVHNNGGELL